MTNSNLPDDYALPDNLKNSFYVYELSVEETGEIFFVGYDVDDEDWRYYGDNPTAEIYEQKFSHFFSVKKDVLATGLKESAAESYVENEKNRIKKRTNFMLCDYENVSYFRNDSYVLGEAPLHTVSNIERHYFGWRPIPFDVVDISNLSTIYIDDAYMDSFLMEGIYGNDFSSKYYELKRKLEALGSTIRTTKYAKSVTAWIATGGSTVEHYYSNRENAESKLGHTIPIYHMLDVLKALSYLPNDIEVTENDSFTVNPVNNRCPLSEVRNLGNSHAGFDEGFPYYEKGEKLRLSGEEQKAIDYFDKAREAGYDAPALYNSYAKAYRKLKDYENEYDIIKEEYERAKTHPFRDGVEWQHFYVKKEEEMEKVKQKIQKKREKSQQLCLFSDD